MPIMASMMKIMASKMTIKLNLEEEENSLLTTVAPLTDAHAVFHLRLGKDWAKDNQELTSRMLKIKMMMTFQNVTYPADISV